MPYAICPECDEDIYLRIAPSLGDLITCPSCETRLEVVGVNPLELDWPWEEDEDEEEEDDEFDLGDDEDELDDDDKTL